MRPEDWAKTAIVIYCVTVFALMVCSDYIDRRWPIATPRMVVAGLLLILGTSSAAVILAVTWRA